MSSLNPLTVRPPRLILIEPGGKQREIVVTASPFRIGRQEGNELTLHDSRISRQQARIVAAEDGYMLEDMSSRHGTFVNGQKVLRHELHSRDSIDFGIADSYRLLYIGDGVRLEQLIEEVSAQAPRPGSRNLQHLGFLLEVARTMGTGVSLEDVLTNVVDASLELTHTQRGILLLVNSSGKLTPTVARGAHRSALSLDQIQVSSTVIQAVLSTRREVIVSDTVEDSTIQRQSSIAQLELRTVIAVPIHKFPLIQAGDMTVAVQQSELLGVLYLDSQLSSEAFSDLDREVLRTLAHEAAVVVENARLFSAAQEKVRLDHEIEIASEIQRQLQPKRFPDEPELEFGGFMLACHSVGGDCFDVTELGGGRYGFFVGDIAGKGISASLLASMLQGVIGSLTLLNTHMAEILSRVNRYVYDRTPEDRYATLFYGILDTSGRLEYINAGHSPALIRRRTGGIDVLPSVNFPVGLFPDVQFIGGESQISHGDFLMLYTDGISEAENVRGEMFEEDRLRKLLQEFSGDTAEHLADIVRRTVQTFAQGAPQRDDMTLLIAHARTP